MELVVVRHGSTPLNEKSIIIGHQPVSLSEKGKIEAQTIGKALAGESFDYIITSDLPRTEETAHIINEMRLKPLIIKKEPRLREINYGTDSGKVKAKLRKEESRYHTDITYKHEKGESFQELYDRVTQFVNELDGKMLLVTHAGCIRALYAFCKGEPFEQHMKIKLGHASILRCDPEKKTASIIHL